MQKKFSLFFITMVLFFMESVLLSRFSFNGAVLPLIFTFGLTMSVLGRDSEVIFLALLVGFLADIYSSHLFGLNMLLNLYFFLALNVLKNRLRQDNNLLMASVMALTTFLRFSLHFGINRLTGLGQQFGPVPILTLMVLLLGIPFLIVTRRSLKIRGHRVRLT